MKKTSVKRALACLLALLLCVGSLTAAVTAAPDQDPASDPAASVTLRYRYLTYDGEYNWVLASVEPSNYPTLQEAFTAAENEDYLDTLPEEIRQLAAEQPSYFMYEPPILTLLQDAVVDTELAVNCSIELDLNGHTLSVSDDGALTGSGWITLSSSTPGVFSSSGTIAVEGLGPWTGDTVNITGGTVSGYFGVDGGTVNVSGGALLGGFMFNNGGAAPIDATFSGSACIADLSPWSFVIYAPAEFVYDENPWNNIHLTLSGGYYGADPRILYKTLIYNGSNYDEYTISETDRYDPVMTVMPGYHYYTRTGDSEENYVYTEIGVEDVLEQQLANSEIFLCYRDFVTVDDSTIEQYNGQSDWAADPELYPWRIAAAAAPARTPGDLTGDDKVNGKDVVLLQRYLAGGYGVTLEEAAADLNHDSKLNGKDVVLLQRFLAGGYGIVLS